MNFPYLYENKKTMLSKTFKRFAVYQSSWDLCSSPFSPSCFWCCSFLRLSFLIVVIRLGAYINPRADLGSTLVFPPWFKVTPKDIVKSPYLKLRSPKRSVCYLCSTRWVILFIQILNFLGFVQTNQLSLTFLRSTESLYLSGSVVPS